MISKRASSLAFATVVGMSFAAMGSDAAAAEALSGQQRAELAGQRLLGSRAPALVLETIDGQTIDLGKLYGKKAVYLKFWATWCIPCREQMPHFERTYQAAGSDLAVIAVDTGLNDSLEDVRTFRQKVGLTMPIVIDDGRLATALNLRVTPQHVVIDRNGRIAYVGHLADERLEAALSAARKSNPAPVKVAQISASLPDISARTLDGQTFRTRDARTRGATVVVFLTPWCESYLAESRPAMATSCRQVREQVDALVRQRSDVRWLGVASGLWATEAELSDYQAQYNTQLPLTLDDSGVWFRSMGVTNVPTVLIANAKGEIVRRVEGFNPRLSEELQKLAR